MTDEAIERARERLREAAEGRPDAAAVDAALERRQPPLDRLPAGGDQVDQQSEVVHARVAFREQVALDALETADHLVHEAADLGEVAADRANLLCEPVADRVLDLGRDRRLELGSLAGALSFLPGGLGVAEASMTALIKALGDTTKGQAAAATVLIRHATLWFAVALGLIGLAVEERLYRRSQPVRRSSSR